MARRFFAFVLVFIMLFSAMPMQAFAAGDSEAAEPGDGYILTQTDENGAPTDPENQESEPVNPETEPENDGEDPVTEPDQPENTDTEPVTDPEGSEDGLQTPDEQDPQAAPDEIQDGSQAESEEPGEESADLLGDDADTTYDFNPDTGYPTNLKKNAVYLAIYDGTGFPGEPAWYPMDRYTYFTGNFTEGMPYANSAEGVLKEEILDVLTQGPTTNGVKVWGYYSAAGTKSFFVDGSPLTNPENEAKIIRAIKGRNANVDQYRIIWYVIKFQTDTFWHIDGLVVEKNTYNVNYYGNGNTSGDAPTGATGLPEGYVYTVLDNTGNLRKIRNGLEFTFLGWNTRADGRGTPYDPDDTITIVEDVSLYAQWQSPMINISVTKTWSDNDDQDNIRPDSVEVYLLQNGIPYGSQVTLSEKNNWTGSWRVPAFDQSGNEYTYNVEEANVEGYTSVVSGSASRGFKVTNTHVPETTSVQVQKVWEDDNDRDGIQPASVTLQLYKTVGSTKTAVGRPVSVSNSSSWTQQWHDLPKYEGGQLIAYSVEETVVPSGYTVSYGTDETGRLKVVNTHEIERTSITATKVWNDNDNQDNIRPDSVTLTLYANGVSTTQTVEVTPDSDGVWTAVFTNLPKNANGAAIVYSVVEEAADVPEGYTVSGTGTSENGYTITNVHVPETTEVTVTKSWDDGDDQDGIRPDSITAVVYADGVQVASVELNVANNWTATVTGLAKYADGVEIVYTVGEPTVPAGYTSSVNGSTITNKHTPEVAQLNVEKVWNDFGDNDGKRPDAVIVTLHVNGEPTAYTLTLSDSSNWKGSWNDMPRYHNGQRISYTVVETGYIIDGITYNKLPSGYTVTHSYDTTNTSSPKAIITNTYTPETVGLNVQKVWDDADNQDGIRPDSITVELYQKISEDGEWTPTGITAQLSRENEWDADFTGLPKYHDGYEIQYKVEETPVAGYEAPKYALDKATGVVTVTNTHVPETTQVSVTKVWDDADDQDGIRPDEITVELYANGIATGKTAVLSESNGWQAVFQNLDKFAHGREVVYTIVEAAVSGYTMVDSNGNPITDAASVNGSVTVTNKHVPETVSVPVTKDWQDNDDQDGIRPDAVTVTLYADGTAVDTMVLTASGNWKGAFTDLPKYDDGREIKYSVGEAEADVPEGYSATVNGNVITNTHTPEKTSVKVQKIWDDEDDQDGVRPESIVVYLRKNGAPFKSAVVDSTTNWAYEWTGLDKFEEAKEINYTVYEAPIYIKNDAGEDVPSGYSASYDWVDGVNQITNTRDTEKTSYTVQKVWVDANNQDAIRPYGVVVQLYADGAAHGEPVTLNAANNWRHNWAGLEAHADNSGGRDIVYTVEELHYVDADGNVIPLEDVDYTNGTPTADPLTGVVTMTNTHVPEKTSVSVKKVWNDADDQDGIRPDSITVTLYKNGVAAETAELNDGNNWSYTFTNLDVHHGIGVDNVYTVGEAVPAGYTAEITGNAADGYTITNVHVPETTEVTVTKSWDDGDDQDGIRPDSITAVVYAGGNQVASVELNAANNWTATVTGLAKYDDGVEIVYTVGESAVPTGYTASVNGSTITNKHTPEVAQLNVEKVWKDFGNNDGKRPYAVVITLYVNGEPTAYTLTLSGSNNWKGSWNDMPRYHNGQRISYTVVETGYYMTEDDLANGNLTTGVPSGYTVTHSYDTANTSSPKATVTNTYTPETVGLNVQKVWDDADNQDGIRPDSITVELHQKISEDGEWTPTGITAQLSRENEWDADFTGLPKYHDGYEIQYNVVETPVAGYEAPKYALDKATGVVTVTNTHVPETTQISVTKVWDDADDQDGIRPDSVTVELYANGIATGKTAVLSESNGWQAVFQNLDKYAHGREVVYTIVEAAAAGYTMVDSNGNPITAAAPANGNVTITNKHVPETVSIPVEKLWADADDQDGMRPESITVTLYADGEATDKVLTLTADQNWQGAFTDLPKYKDGEEIAYAIVEAAIEGYNVDDSGKALPMTVEVVDGKITITNTHEAEKTTLTAIKVWDDNNDQDGKRPESITLHLLANGVHMGDSYKAVLTAENVDKDGNWTYTWENLDMYAAGHLIRYTVYEEPVYFKSSDAGAETEGESADIAPQTDETYIASYKRDSEIQITVTNTYVPETTVVTAMKIWDDGDNRDGLRPESIAVELYRLEGDQQVKADGAETIILDEANNWVASWTDLPKYENHGVEIVYVVVEKDVPAGYESTVVRDEEFAPGVFIVTNTHAPETTGVTVTKIWADENDNDGMRPDGIIVQLYADGSAVEVNKVLLDASNNWTYTWESTSDMPLYVYNEGELVQYYVLEVGYVIDGVEYVGLPDGYEGSTAVGDNAYDISITNTRPTEKVSVSVTKQWDDGDDNDGIRPDSVEVTLQKNGADVETVILDESNQWTYTWSDLYKYDRGIEVVYTVVETEVEGYTAAYSAAAEGAQITLTVTNTHEAETKARTITKVWKDNNDAEGLRPVSVTAQLYKNGVAYGDVIKLSAANNWQYTMELPVYEDGEMIVWTVKETEIPRYYTVSYDQSTLTITNTIQSKEVPKTGDYTNLWQWILVFGGCVAGAVAVVFYDKKKKHA